jgi:hypothetical protein
MTPEQIELHRLCAVRTLENQKKGLRQYDAQTLAQAEEFVHMHAPLATPMGDGMPALAPELKGMEVMP